MDVDKLVREYQNTTDPEEKRDIIENLYRQYKDLIYKISFSFVGFAEVDDLIQECYFGLVYALDNYDPESAGFTSWLTKNLKWQIYRYLGTTPENSKNVKKIRKFEERFFSYYHRYPTAEETAKHFGTEPQHIISIKALSQPKSLDDIIPGTDETIGENVPDSAESPEDIAVRECVCDTVRAAVQRLPEDERTAVTAHYFHGIPQTQIPNGRSAITRGLKHLEYDRQIINLAKEEGIISRVYRWHSRDISSTEWAALELYELSAL